MRIYKHTSFLTYLRQEYCLTCAAGGVGGLRGDVTGVGNPSDALENPSDDLGNPSDVFGASQILCTGHNLFLVRSKVKTKVKQNVNFP